MTLLAVELVALILIVAADDATRGRPPAATWSTSLRVVGATVAAVMAASLIEAAIDRNVL